MKKILALFIAVVTVLLLVSCDIAFTESTDDIKTLREIIKILLKTQMNSLRANNSKTQTPHT